MRVETSGDVLAGDYFQGLDILTFCVLGCSLVLDLPKKLVFPLDFSQ